MNTINCVLLFYNDTFGIVNVFSILSAKNIELWYITIHDVVHAPVAVDDRRRWMQIIIWFLVVVDLFQRSVWGHSSGDEHSGRTRQTAEGWKGNVNTEYSMLEDAENALVLASPWPWPWPMMVDRRSIRRGLLFVGCCQQARGGERRSKNRKEAEKPVAFVRLFPAFPTSSAPVRRTFSQVSARIQQRFVSKIKARSRFEEKVRQNLRRTDWSGALFPAKGLAFLEPP